MNTPTPPIDHLTVRARGHWAAEEIPPRCRKPRMVEHETTAVSSVPIVTPAQAPAAFRIRTHRGEGSHELIRLHGGLLFARYAHHDGSPRELPAEVDSDREHLWPTADCELIYQMSFDVWAARFLIIRTDDGDEVWETTGEPRYYVTTFGMGGNHGGTALMAATDDPSGTRADAIFRADDYAAARAHAEQVADRRGDTDSVGRFRQDIEVLIPEAVTLQTVSPTPQEVEDLRFDYRMAVGRLRDRADSPGHEGPAFAEVARLRQAIIDTGHPVVADDTRPFELRHLERSCTAS